MCRRLPASFLQRAHPLLRWDEASGRGTFGAVTLFRRALRGEDELPEQSWRAHVACVLTASGRLDDDATFDAFYAWVRALVDAARGALFDPQEGRFSYVWVDAEATRARAHVEAEALCRDRNLAALAELVDRRWSRYLASGDEAEQLAAWDEIWDLHQQLRPLLEAAIAEDDAAAAPALKALHRAMQRHAQIGDLDALVLDAATRPALGADLGLRELAAQVAPFPATLPELEALLDAAAPGDALTSLRLGRLAEWRAPERESIVIALARSGRALPPALVAELGRLDAGSFALADDALRAELRAAGALGRALADAHDAQRAAANGARANLQRQTEVKRAQNDAYYGAKRDRPRTAEPVIQLVKKGQLASARAAYAKAHPEFAQRAAEAVEDARRFFAPKVRSDVGDS